MNEQIEVSKLAVEFLDKFGEKLWSDIKTIYKKASNEVRRDWKLGYENYLENALNKYSKAKTFLSFNQPLPLYDLYVPLSVACGGHLVEKASITDLMDANKFSVIMATGGSGKTMMMRHLFVDTIRKTSQVPVFVELRELNDSELDLFGLIKKKLRDNKFDFGDDYIEKAFKAGHFVLLLDGFDEVADAKRDDIFIQLKKFANYFDNNYIILSSRPDVSLRYWSLSNIWQVQSLTLDLACELIEKTEVDEEIKEKFINTLKDELFEKHKSFLSNPLLLAIMLITYQDSANIPEKITTYYERAYIALFEQHDARKALYRPKRSNLDILDFKKIFSAFCFLTYNKKLYNYSEVNALEYLEKAQQYTGLDFKREDFLHDCIQAVCLLLRDGLDITFSHRSFQEYFTALFVSQIDNAKVQSKFLKSQFNSWNISQPVKLLFEISPETIEKHLLIPVITDVERTIKYDKQLTIESYERFIKKYIKVITLLPNRGDESGIGSNYWHVGVIPHDIWLNESFDFVLKYYLGIQPFHYLDVNSNIFQLLYERQKRMGKIDFDSSLRDEELLYLLAKGEHLLSMNYFQKIFDVKKQLVEKHKKQEMFLEEELFE